MRVESLGIIARVHRRAEYLDRIVAQCKVLGAGRRLQIVFVTDRTTPEVDAAIERARAESDLRVTVVPAPSPVLSYAGQRWMEASQAGLEAFEPGTQVGMMWDDDVLFSDAALAALIAHLDDLRVDKVRTCWLHVWTPDGKINTKMAPHWATSLFRVVPGDKYLAELVAHAPAGVERSASTAVVHAPVLHYGYCTEEERMRCWAACREAGKLDAHVMGLLEPPELKEVPC